MAAFARHTTPGLARLGPAFLRDVRDLAAHHAACPVCLRDLRSQPDQVGALLSGGRRVEPALYLKSAVVDEDGDLLFSESPVVRGLAVDDFQLMPAMSSCAAVAAFVDWDCDGQVGITDLATALAAILPVDGDAAERFLRDRFDVDRGGLLNELEVAEQVLPHLGGRLGELLASCPVAMEPELCRQSSREELLAWFDHFDTERSREVHFSQLRFAVARVMYGSLGAASLDTKEAVVARFFAGADVASTDGIFTREAFEERLAPALKANLAGRRSLREKQISTLPPRSSGQPKVEWMIRVVLHSPSSGESVSLEVPRDGSVADLRASCLRAWGASGPQMLCVNGQLLSSDSDLLSDIYGFESGCVVQALPDPKRGSSECAIS